MISTTSNFRESTKTIRQDFTLAFREAYLRQYGQAPNSEAYRALTNQVYTILFGCDADALRARLALPDKANVRDSLDENQLHSLATAEYNMTNWLNSGYDIERCLRALWRTKNG